MDDSGVPEIGTVKQIDWDNMLESLPDDLNLFDFELDPSLFSDLPGDGSCEEFSNPSPNSISLSIGEIEQLLMNDEEEEEEEENGLVVAEQPILEFSNDILTDVLLDSPAGSDRSGEVVDPSGRNSNASEEEKDEVVPPTEKSDGDVDDPVSKKRKRLLRNKDAAMRSRERKKLYVRDLEMKSRYLEGECRRLGMLLQCCYAENQALRLSLQNSKAFDASMTKQESAVLLLESLLLGSLLWFLGIVCLHILPSSLKTSPGAVELEGVDKKNQGSQTQKRAGNEIFVFELLQSFTTSKRCKASRSRMKPSHAAYVVFEVLV